MPLTQQSIIKYILKKYWAWNNWVGSLSKQLHKCSTANQLHNIKLSNIQYFLRILFNLPIKISLFPTSAQICRMRVTRHADKGSSLLKFTMWKITGQWTPNVPCVSKTWHNIMKHSGNWWPPLTPIQHKWDTILFCFEEFYFAFPPHMIS